MARDYAAHRTHSYQAPRRQIRHRGLKNQHVRKKVIACCVVVAAVSILAALIYEVMWSPLFQVKTIRINGLESNEQAKWLAIVRDYLAKPRGFIFPGQNYFILSPAGLKQYIMSQASPDLLFSEFAIQKKWPNELVANFTERVAILRIRRLPSAVAVVSAMETFYIDHEGIRLASESIDETNVDIRSLPTIDFRSNQKYVLGGRVITPELAKKITSVWEAFLKTRGLPPVRRIELTEDVTQITVELAAGTKILLSLEDSLQEQLDYLRLVLVKIGDNRPTLQYIDLRVAGRAYACCDLENNN